MILTRLRALRRVVRYVLGEEETRCVHTLHIEVQCNGDAKKLVTSTRSICSDYAAGAAL